MNIFINKSTYKNELDGLSTEAQKLENMLDIYTQNKENEKATEITKILLTLMSNVKETFTSDSYRCMKNSNRYYRQLDLAIKRFVTDTKIKNQFQVFSLSLSAYLYKIEHQFPTIETLTDFFSNANFLKKMDVTTDLFKAMISRNDHNDGSYDDPFETLVCSEKFWGLPFLGNDHEKSTVAIRLIEDMGIQFLVRFFCFYPTSIEHMMKALGRTNLHYGITYLKYCLKTICSSDCIVAEKRRNFGSINSCCIWLGCDISLILDQDDETRKLKPTIKDWFTQEHLRALSEDLFSFDRTSYFEFSLFKRFNPEAFSHAVLSQMSRTLKASQYFFFDNVIKILDVLEYKEAFLQANVEPLNQILFDKVQAILLTPSFQRWDLSHLMERVDALVGRETFLQLLSLEDTAKMKELFDFELIEIFRDCQPLESILCSLFPNWKDEIIQWMEDEIKNLRPKLIDPDYKDILPQIKKVLQWLEQKISEMKEQGSVYDAPRYRLILVMIEKIEFLPSYAIQHELIALCDAALQEDLKVEINDLFG